MRCDAAAIEAAWKAIAGQKELASILFSRPGQPYFSLKQPVNCRVKYRDISYQALLAPAGSRIELDVKAAKGDQLSFSLFNLQPGTLTFR